MKVDVGVSKTGASDSIPTDSNTGDRSNAVKQFKEHGLGDAGIKFSHIQTGGGRSAGCRGRCASGSVASGIIAGGRRRFAGGGGRAAVVARLRLVVDRLRGRGRRHERDFVGGIIDGGLRRSLIDVGGRWRRHNE